MTGGMGQTVNLRRKNRKVLMSALGHKRTWRQRGMMSAILPKADIRPGGIDVRFVPKADIRRLIRSLRRRWQAPIEEL
jgi:hypothetical protein